MEVKLRNLVNGSTKSCGCLRQELVSKRFPPRKFLTFDGATHSLVHWAKVRNILPSTLGTRLRIGWSLAQALGYDLPPERRPLIGGRVFEAKLITYRGETKPVREFAEEYGIAHTLVLSRLRGKWSIEEALGILPRVRRRILFPARVTQDELDDAFEGNIGQCPDGSWK